MLIARAHQHGELTGTLWAAIDVTKGFPFTGDAAEHEDDILGHRAGNEHYQWAVCKIVEELLTHATAMVTLDLV